MSTALYRWGRWTSAHPWRVLLASLVVVLGMGGLVGVTGVAFDDEFSIPGTEAQQGLEALEQRFPQAAGASAQVVVVAPEGERLADGDARDQVDDLVARLADVEHVTAATSPFDGGTTVSDDGRYALVQVQLDPDVAVLDEETKDALAEAAAVPEGSGLRSSLGGAALQEQGVHLSVTEGLGVVVAMVVLAITFGSALAAGIPLVTALIGVVVGLAGLAAATAVTSVNSSSPTLALMIGLAVGIDYALFVVSRHRTNLAESDGRCGRVGRPLARDGRQRRGLRRRHRRHRAARPVRGADPVPHRDGRRGGRHRRRRRRGGADRPAGRALAVRRAVAAQAVPSSAPAQPWR